MGPGMPCGTPVPFSLSDVLVSHVHSVFRLRYACLSLGSTWLSTAPIIVARLMPANLKGPSGTTTVDSPNTNTAAAIIRLRVEFMSAPENSVEMPTEAIMPNSRMLIPPITGVGMLRITPPTLPKKANPRAKNAAPRRMAGSYTPVRLRVAVFSL